MAKVQGARASIEITSETAISQLQELAKNGGDTRQLMGRLGEYFVKSTRDRFASQTDPQGHLWASYAPLSPGWIKRKRLNKDKILTLEGRMRKYLNSQPVSQNEVVWGSNRKYAAIHNMGGDGMGRNGKMPQRQFLGVSAADNKEALEIVHDWLHRKLNGLPD